MSAGQSNSIGNLPKFLSMFASAPHEEQEVYDVEDEADGAESDPEETAEENAEEEGDSPKSVSSHDTPPEDGLVEVVSDKAFVGHEHPLLLSRVEVHLHPPHHVDQPAS